MLHTVCRATVPAFLSSLYVWPELQSLPHLSADAVVLEHLEAACFHSAATAAAKDAE